MDSVQSAKTPRKPIKTVQTQPSFGAWKFTLNPWTAPAHRWSMLFGIETYWISFVFDLFVIILEMKKRRTYSWLKTRNKTVKLACLPVPKTRYGYFSTFLGLSYPASKSQFDGGWSNDVLKKSSDILKEIKNRAKKINLNQVKYVWYLMAFDTIEKVIFGWIYSSSKNEFHIKRIDKTKHFIA